MKTLVFTPGDPEGIGPEVTAKALHRLRRKLSPHSILIFGSKAPFKKYKKLVSAKNIKFADLPLRADPGFQSGWAIEQATKLVLASPHDHALVTGPINKSRLNDGGYHYQGHTDFLGSLSGTKNPTMMLSNPYFRVALVTQHCPLKEVASLITEASLWKTISDTVSFLESQVAKKKPKISILGLNPHAGEDGLLGDEESQIIVPTIERARIKFKSIKFSGPHSADSFFSLEMKKKKAERSDAIIAMYHDQGLIPVKLMGFHQSINVTLGLPFFRTSVDHGTAFDIAGKNIANSDSMVLAIETALEFLSTRKPNRRK